MDRSRFYSGWSLLCFKEHGRQPQNGIEMIKIFFLILGAEIWSTAGQILFKKGTNRLLRPHLRSLASYLGFTKKILLMPAIWLGFASMALGLFIWLMALSRADLSLVFPLGSLQYILTLVSARLFLNEKIDRMKLVGTFLVVVGIVVISFS